MKKVDSKTAQEILKRGMKEDFWQLILANLDESIENLRNKQNSDEIRDLPAEQYKVENEIIKASISNLQDLKRVPQNIISWLDDPNTGETDINFDPYPSLKDFDKKT